jgi:RNA polymerase sigma factor (sigma-70 family)
MVIQKDILELCKANNRKGQEALYRLCYPELMRILFRYCTDQAQAAELLNNAMFKVFNKLHQFEGDHHNCFAWIKRIAINEALDWLRKSKKLNPVLPIENANPIAVDHPSGYTDAKELMKRLLNRLPVFTATVFNLHVLEGYSHMEIAEQLEISVANSKWHVHTARKKLQDMIKQNQAL